MRYHNQKWNINNTRTHLTPDRKSKINHTIFAGFECFSAHTTTHSAGVYVYYLVRKFLRRERRVCRKKHTQSQSCPEKTCIWNTIKSHRHTHGVTAMALHKNERNGLHGAEERILFFFMIMTHEIPYRQTHKLTATRPYYSDHKRSSLSLSLSVAFPVCARARWVYVRFRFIHKFCFASSSSYSIVFRH